MQRRLKLILFVFLFALLWLPFFQEQTKYFKEPILKGAFIKPVKPNFSIDSLNELKFQKQFEDYENYNFGFRGLMVKIRNSLNYILFKELSCIDNIAGKSNFIFSVGSTERTLGIRYNSKEQNNSTIEKINFLKEGLESHGGKLICLLVPSKETIYPDFLPAPYRGNYKSQTDYADFIEGYKKYNISVIDYCEYFKQLKNTTRYPLYTTTGVHWSLYGASVAQDTLVNYIEKIVGKAIPKYKRDGVELSDTARESDNDFEAPLNLLFGLGQPQYIYPKLQMIESTRKNYRPKVIIIGDSFFWQIKNHRMLMNIFTEDSKFWYYFAMNSCPIGDAAGCPLKDINIMKELETADIVLLISNISTLDRFPFGVTDYYYNNVAPPEILESVCQNIKGSSAWMANLNNKTSTTNLSIDEKVTAEAKRICRNKKNFTLKAANDKYICAGGAEDKILFANRDAGSDWETFSALFLENDKVAIYSYKNKFLSSELSNKAEIVSNKIGIDTWEMFTIIRLDNDFVAFKASNGKYFSLDEKSLQIFATGSYIGKNEKFKLTNIK
ncbi:MAG TPA: hypothetical protein VF411_10645 [Bacteroidia bacterium]